MSQGLLFAAPGAPKPPLPHNAADNIYRVFKKVSHYKELSNRQRG